MKNIMKIICLLFVFVLSLSTLISCGDDDIKYQANTRFLYSVDGGNSWSETLQEIGVNTTYYLAVEMQVVQSAETEDEKIVEASVTIPNTNVLDCYLDDHPGVTITGVPDPINNSITYKFNVVAGTSPAKFRAVFECTPLAAGKASIFVVYDDSVNSSWDATGTIKYVTLEE